jgi:hypothetical protein
LAPGVNSAPGGREGEGERERERLLHFAARGNKKERNTNAHCTLAVERRRNGKTDEEERREFAPVLDLVFSLSFACCVRSVFL